MAIDRICNMSVDETAALNAERDGHDELDYNAEDWQRGLLRQTHR